MSSTSAPSGVGAPAPVAVRAQPTTRFRRVSGALALVIAPWGFVAANSAYAWATRNGGDDLTGANRIALATSHASVLHFGVVAAGLGCLLIVPAVLAAMRLLRATAPKLSLVGGASMIAGYCCYLGGLTQDFVPIAMAERGGPLDDYAAVLDASHGYPSGIWMLVLFAFGNIIGTFLLAVALYRSRPVAPRWAAAGVAAWPVLHITGLSLGSEWFEVTGGVLQALGFAAVAAAVLRVRDADWNPEVVRLRPE